MRQWGGVELEETENSNSQQTGVGHPTESTGCPRPRGRPAEGRKHEAGPGNDQHSGERCLRTELGKVRWALPRSRGHRALVL